MAAPIENNSEQLVNEFIYFHFQEIEKQIKYGPENAQDNKKNDRAEYFDEAWKSSKVRRPISWDMDKITSEEVFKAIQLFHNICHKVDNLGEFGAIPKSIDTIYELACHENKVMEIFSYERLMALSDQIFKLIYTEFKINDEIVTVYGKPIDEVSYDDRVRYYCDYIDNNYYNNRGRKQLMYALKNIRNKLSHQAFLQNPTIAWKRLEYSLYDYITILFFIMKRKNYFGNVQISKIKLYIKSEDDLSKKNVVLIKNSPSDCVKLESDKKGTFFYVERFSKYQLSCDGNDSAPFIIDHNFFDGCELKVSIPVSAEEPQPIKLEKLSGMLSGTLSQVMEHLKKLEKHQELKEFIEKLLCAKTKDEFNNAIEKAEKIKLQLEILGNIGTNGADVEKQIDRLAEEVYKTLHDTYKQLYGKICEMSQCVIELHIDVQEIQKKQYEASQKLLEEHAETKNKLEQIIQDVGKAASLTEIIKLENEFEGLKKGIDKWRKDVEHIRRTTDDTRSDVITIKSILKKWDEWKKRKIILGGGLALIFVICLACCLWAEPLYNQTKNEIFCKLAYNFGNQDIAYNHAKYLEGKKELRKACFWYNKAKERYREVIAADTTNSEAAYRMAKMLIRLKGGTDNSSRDFKEALRYARLGSPEEHGIGLYAYTNMMCGNYDKARELVEIYKGNDDKYLQLVDISLLMETKIIDSDSISKNIQNAFNELKELAFMSHNEAQEESALLVASVLEKGIRDSEGDYIINSNLYSSVQVLSLLCDKNNLWGQRLVLSIPVKIPSYIGWLYLSNKLINNMWANGDFECAPLIMKYIEKNVVPKPDFMDELTHHVKILSEKSYNPLHYMNEMEYLAGNPLTANTAFDKAQKADSLLRDNRFMTSSQLYEEQVFTMFLKNKKYNDSILSYPDSALRDYLMGVKFLKGYGVDKNIAKGDSLIKSAADAHHQEAIYAWAYHLVLNKRLFEAITYLKKNANTDVRALEALAQIYSIIDTERSREYLEKIEDDVNLYKVIHWLDNDFPKKYENKTDLEAFHDVIDIIENAITNNVFQDRAKCAYLLHRMTQLQVNIGVPMEVLEFYAGLAIAIEPGIGCLTLVTLSDYALVLGDREKAADAYLEFCLHFFKKNGTTMDDSSRERVINKLLLQFPEKVLDVNRHIGYDLRLHHPSTEKLENITPFTYLENMDMPSVDILVKPFAYKYK